MKIKCIFFVSTIFCSLLPNHGEQYPNTSFYEQEISQMNSQTTITPLRHLSDPSRHLNEFYKITDNEIIDHKKRSIFLIVVMPHYSILKYMSQHTPHEHVYKTYPLSTMASDYLSTNSDYLDCIINRFLGKVLKQSSGNSIVIYFSFILPVVENDYTDSTNTDFLFKLSDKFTVEVENGLQQKGCYDFMLRPINENIVLIYPNNN